MKRGKEVCVLIIYSNRITKYKEIQRKKKNNYFSIRQLLLSYILSFSHQIIVIFWKEKDNKKSTTLKRTTKCEAVILHSVENIKKIKFMVHCLYVSATAM